ncbi:MAG: DUF6599 family protein [Acidobacteriota bacterium]
MVKTPNILVWAFILFFCGCLAAESAESSIDLKSYLPAKEDLGAWKASGAPQEFRGDDLYVYMDGGAAIYDEYGFRKLLVQDYANPNGESLTLEIYEMEEPAAAYGIYTYKTSSQGRRIQMGQEGSLEDYYLNFWKGPYLITLTGFDQGQEMIHDLLRIGQLVDSKIQKSAAPPVAPGWLPERDLIPSSIKYFRGPLGLLQNYAFTATDVFKLREGVKGDYSPGYSFYVIVYESAERSLERFTALGEHLEKDVRFKNFYRAEGNLLFLEDDQGRCLGLKAFRRLILLVVGRVSPELAANLLKAYEVNRK